MNNQIIIDVQFADDLPASIISTLPTQNDLDLWLSQAYTLVNETSDVTHAQGSELPAELSIRVVSLKESQSLNAQYRGKDSATNVLSFESDLPDFVPSGFLGDLVICAQIVENEALEQQKMLNHHWAHMCIHGMLHLLGFDHIKETDALEMESLELAILAKLGIDDPYQIS